MAKKNRRCIRCTQNKNFGNCDLIICSNFKPPTVEEQWNESQRKFCRYIGCREEVVYLALKDHYCLEHGKLKMFILKTIKEQL